MAVTSPNKCTSGAHPLAASHDDEIVECRQSVKPFGEKVRVRRLSPVAAGTGEGHLTEPRAVAQPGQRELVLMPQSGPCPDETELPDDQRVSDPSRSKEVATAEIVDC